MYNKRHGCAGNWRKEYLASSQVVGGSSPSGRAKIINDLARFRKFVSSNKNKNIKVVIGGWGATVGSVLHQPPKRKERFILPPNIPVDRVIDQPCKVLLHWIPIRR